MDERVMPSEYNESQVEPLYLSPNGVAVDAGANVGMHTLAMARHMRLVMAFEPDPLNFERLTETVVSYGLSNVVPVRAALGAESGLLPMVSAGGQTRRAGLESVHNSEILSEFVSPVMTLDQLCLGWQRLDVLKVDVEGMELDVLRGGKATIESLGPTIVIENHDNIEPGYQTSFGEVISFLANFGYRGILVNHQNYAFRR